jgi:hemerythrin-like domain-containing protein
MQRATRRIFLITVASAGVGIVTGSRVFSSGVPKQKDRSEVTPVEDLMREHGVLDRILLIYEEIGRRIATRQAVRADALSGAASIVQRFIEGYHEKLEEDHLFPRFEKAGRLVDLVTVLRTQHVRGRALTSDVLQLGGAAGAASQERLQKTLQLFIRMYRPHAAREDTVLFPALHELVTRKEYESLGDIFEDQEHELFGARGFEGVVDEVAQLERDLDIHDLGQFTP